MSEEPISIQEEDLDPQAESRIAAFFMVRDILADEGGLLSVKQMAEQMGTSQQQVDTMREQGQLIAFLMNGSRAYPAWQVGLPDFPRVIAMSESKEGHDFLTLTAFMLNPNLRLDGARPLDCLHQGQVDLVVEVLRLHGEHEPI